MTSIWRPRFLQSKSELARNNDKTNPYSTAISEIIQRPITRIPHHQIKYNGVIFDVNSIEVLSTTGRVVRLRPNQASSLLTMWLGLVDSSVSVDNRNRIVEMALNDRSYIRTLDNGSKLVYVGDSTTHPYSIYGYEEDGMDLRRDLVLCGVRPDEYVVIDRLPYIIRMKQ